MNKLFLVAKREYIKVVRKPTFWISTLALPILMLVIGFISGYSAQASQDKLAKEAQSAKTIYIVDEANAVDPNLIKPPFTKSTDLQGSIDSVKKGSADAVFYYPKDVYQSKNITIYEKDTGFMGSTKYNDIATNLIKQSILAKINDTQAIAAFNKTYIVNTQSYKNGILIENRIEDLVPAIISLVLYILLISFSTSYLLLSVSEEKENRMIETILSILKPRELIWGKIVGQIGIIFTQVAFLSFLSVFALKLTKINLPIDLSAISITPVQILTILFYTLTGFLILANMMVGVASIVPTYKDAQSTSSIFIFLSIIPLYFITIILADPNGTIARIASYFPFTASMVMIFRVALGSVPVWEIVLSSVILVIFTVLSFFISSKLFELGSLEYSKKFSLIEVLKYGFGKKVKPL